MAQRQLFPRTFIGTSVEHYTFLLRKSTVSIYLVLVIAVLLLIIALPFVSVQLSKTVGGVVGTASDRFVLSTPTSGFVVSNQLRENRHVRRGDTLLVFDRIVLLKEQEQVSDRLAELAHFLDDLNRLVAGDAAGGVPTLTSSRFRIAYRKFETRHNKLILERQHLEKQYERQKHLFALDIISEVEFEQDQANYQRAAAEAAWFVRQAANEWKEQALTLREEKKRLLFRKKEIETELLRYVLLSPCAGELQQVVSLAPRQFMAAGVEVGNITPDSDLLAICRVSPRDIGLIRPGMTGLFRVDAFNANEWGTLRGEVVAISSDVYIIDAQPFFKVECRLEQDHLTLKNGVTGKLKKGMTLEAGFSLTRRTLYQLLYDKVDDWLNPTRS